MSDESGDLQKHDEDYPKEEDNGKHQDAESKAATKKSGRSFTNLYRCLTNNPPAFIAFSTTAVKRTASDDPTLSEAMNITPEKIELCHNPIDEELQSIE